MVRVLVEEPGTALPARGQGAVIVCPPSCLSRWFPSRLRPHRRRPRHLTGRIGFALSGGHPLAPRTTGWSKCDSQTTTLAKRVVDKRFRRNVRRRAVPGGRRRSNWPWRRRHRFTLGSPMRSSCAAYRSGDCGRKRPNKRVVTGRCGPVTTDRAPRKAQEFPGRVAGQDDPAVDRTGARGIPTPGDAVEGCVASKPDRSDRTDEFRCYEVAAARGALSQLPPMDWSSIGRRMTLQSAGIKTPCWNDQDRRCRSQLMVFRRPKSRSPRIRTMGPSLPVRTRAD